MAAIVAAVTAAVPQAHMAAAVPLTTMAMALS